MEVLTVGYGGATADTLIQRLAAAEVTHVADVRSVPKSPGRPEFDQGALTAALRAVGITYVFLGAELGGRPRESDCYIDGRVDYPTVRTKGFFRAGIQRVRKGLDAGYRIALLCSEAKPEQCHRTRLVGEALQAAGIAVKHIEADGEVTDHDSVMARLHAGQQSLGFIDDVNQSRRRVAPVGRWSGRNAS